MKLISEFFILGDVVESLSNVVEISSVHSSDGNSSISSHVNGIVLLDLLNHILREASESKHSDLAGDMVPVVRVSVRLELFNEARSHFFNASRHHLQFVVPFLLQLLI